MNSRIENGNLVIELPLEKPRPSASGKTLLVASTRGVKQSTARLKGQTISIVANAFIFPTGKVTPPGGKQSKNRLQKAKQEEAEDDGEGVR